MLQNAGSHIAAIDALVAAETLVSGVGGPELTSSVKALQLLEIAAAGGVNNTLQRLVDPVWAVYAAPDASATSTLFTLAGLGAIFSLAFPFVTCLFCGRLAYTKCQCRCCTKAARKFDVNVAVHDNLKVE